MGLLSKPSVKLLTISGLGKDEVVSAALYVAIHLLMHNGSSISRVLLIKQAVLFTSLHLCSELLPRSFEHSVDSFAVSLPVSAS